MQLTELSKKQEIQFLRSNQFDTSPRLFNSSGQMNEIIISREPPEAIVRYHSPRPNPQIPPQPYRSLGYHASQNKSPRFGNDNNNSANIKLLSIQTFSSRYQQGENVQLAPKHEKIEFPSPSKESTNVKTIVRDMRLRLPIMSQSYNSLPNPEKNYKDLQILSDNHKIPSKFYMEGNPIEAKQVYSFTPQAPIMPAQPAYYYNNEYGVTLRRDSVVNEPLQERAARITITSRKQSVVSDMSLDSPERRKTSAALFGEPKYFSNFLNKTSTDQFDESRYQHQQSEGQSNGDTINDELQGTVVRKMYSPLLSSFKPFQKSKSGKRQDNIKDPLTEKRIESITMKNSPKIPSKFGNVSFNDTIAGIYGYATSQGIHDLPSVQKKSFTDNMISSKVEYTPLLGPSKSSLNEGQRLVGSNSYTDYRHTSKTDTIDFQSRQSYGTPNFYPGSTHELDQMPSDTMPVDRSSIFNSGLYVDSSKIASSQHVNHGDASDVMDLYGLRDSRPMFVNDGYVMNSDRRSIQISRKNTYK